MLTDSKLLGVRDVQNILDVSKNYVHRLADEKKLPFEMTSSGKIFLERDVREFQKSREEKAAAGDGRIRLKKGAKKAT